MWLLPPTPFCKRRKWTGRGCFTCHIGYGIGQWPVTQSARWIVGTLSHLESLDQACRWYRWERTIQRNRSHRAFSEALAAAEVPKLGKAVFFLNLPPPEKQKVYLYCMCVCCRAWGVLADETLNRSVFWRWWMCLLSCLWWWYQGVCIGSNLSNCIR